MPGSGAVRSVDKYRSAGKTSDHPELQLVDPKSLIDPRDMDVNEDRRSPTSVQIGSTHYNIGLSGIATPGPTFTFLEGVAGHSYFPASSVILVSPAPSGTPLSNQYYAPTTRFPNQCFEVGNDYYYLHGVQLTFFVYDWCLTPAGSAPGTKGIFVASVAENASFVNLYVASSPSPHYAFSVNYNPVTQIFTPYLQEIGPGGNGQNDQIMGSHGEPIEESYNPIVLQFTGWSYFESYEVAGMCNSIPNFSMLGMSVTEANSTTVTTTVNFDSHKFDSASPETGAYCNKNSGSIGNWWSITYASPASTNYQTTWTMHSNKSTPLATSTPSSSPRPTNGSLWTAPLEQQ